MSSTGDTDPSAGTRDGGIPPLTLSGSSSNALTSSRISGSPASSGGGQSASTMRFTNLFSRSSSSSMLGSRAATRMTSATIPSSRSIVCLGITETRAATSAICRPKSGGFQGVSVMNRSYRCEAYSVFSSWPAGARLSSRGNRPARQRSHSSRRFIPKPSPRSARWTIGGALTLATRWPRDRTASI